MIRRPEYLEDIPVYLVFNFREFERLEVDLDHINKNNRSSLTIVDVSKAVLMALSGKVLEPSDSKVFLDEVCDYYVVKAAYTNKRYKLVLCICSDRPSTIGVITMHRI